MPGLRSLVARRRCSLPTTQIGPSEPIVCSYPSVAGTISTSRKRNSLDEINQIENVVPTKEGADEEKPKWDLKTLFEIEEESVSSCTSDLTQHRDVFSYYPNKNVSLNGVNLSISEKENNSSINQCANSFYETSDIISPAPETKQDNLIPSNELPNEFERDNNDVSKTKTSPERIVIKMKLLHGSSLSDVTNIAPDSVEGGESIDRPDFAYESGNASKVKTRWTIDSILNQPVEFPKLQNGTSHENSSPTNATTTPSPTYKTKSRMRNEIIDIQEEAMNGIKALDKNDHMKSVSPKEESLNNMNGLACKSRPNGLTKSLPNDPIQDEQEGEVVSIFRNGFNDNVRRSSNSSDISEDSICSEASTMSSSSDSSVKSCSIVIKKLENSNSYSCFRSPKSKRKRCQEAGLSRTVFIKNKNSLPVLYIPKRLLCKNSADVLPCSVTLCDIFSNYPLTKEICPRCFNFYDLSTDLFVNMCSSTVTLQCETCNWLVIRSLIAKEIDVHKQHNSHK